MPLKTINKEIKSELNIFCLSIPLKHYKLVYTALNVFRSDYCMCMNLQLTGLWSKLASRKRVMIEPRAADREDFDGMMKAFYEVVKGDLYTNYCDDGKN